MSMEDVHDFHACSHRVGQLWMNSEHNKIKSSKSKEIWMVEFIRKACEGYNRLVGIT